MEYCLGIYENVDVMVLHDRIHVTEKDGTKHIYRLHFLEERIRPPVKQKKQRKS